MSRKLALVPRIFPLWQMWERTAVVLVLAAAPGVSETPMR